MGKSERVLGSCGFIPICIKQWSGFSLEIAVPKPRQFHCKCCCWLFKELCLLKALRRCGEIKNPVDFSDPPGFWVFWMVACGYTIPSESRWTTSSRRANFALVWVSTDDQPIELTFIWYPWAAHATIPRADCTVAKVVAMAALVNMMWTFNPWLVNRLNFFCLNVCILRKQKIPVNIFFRDAAGTEM